MTTITRTVVVAAPLRTVYNQWTQFEDFPRFIDAVDEVRQLDDRTMHWRVRVAGIPQEFDLEIMIQDPERRITWHALTGPSLTGEVLFATAAPSAREPGEPRTEVAATVGWEPHGLLQVAADRLHLVERMIDDALSRFRDYVEARGVETGGWRGELHNAAGEGGVLRELHPPRA